MDTEELKRRIEQLLTNETFVGELNATSSNDAILKILKDNGIDISEMEMNEILKPAMPSGNGELSAESLDEIAGGIRIGVLPGKNLELLADKWKDHITPVKPRTGKI